MSELESVEIRNARLQWAIDQGKIDLQVLKDKVAELTSVVNKQGEDIRDLRTWRAQMVAVMVAATTAISLLIKKFWN